MQLAFAHLNLRYNPFGDIDRATRARIAVVAPVEFCGDEIVQFIGHEGRGKTTHLLALHRQLPGSVYEHVPDGNDRYVTTEFPPQGFLLDEAQRVKPRLMRKLFARAERLILATHDDLSPLTRRPVRTIRLTGLAQPKLDAVLRERIEAARRAPGPIPRVTQATQRRLIDRYGDDLRSIEAHLYHVFQRLEGPDVDV